MPFTVQDGLAIVQGIRGIEDNRRAREKEQESKDIDAYAQLLTKRQSLQDPEAIRQIDTQMEGYSPSAAIRGTVAYQAMLKGSAEAEAAKFKTQAMQAYPKMKSAETLFKTGETGRAMQQIDEIMTKNLPNGYTYKTVQKEDGKWEQQVYNSRGELTKTNIVDPAGQMEIMSNLMKSPGNLFDLYRKEKLDLRKQNWESMFNYETYQDKDGNEIYTWGQTDENGQYHQIIMDQNKRFLKEFDATRFTKKLTEKEQAAVDKEKAEAKKAQQMGDAYESSVESKGVAGKKYRDERIDTHATDIINSIIDPDSLAPDAGLKRSKLKVVLKPIIEKFVDEEGKIKDLKGFNKAIEDKLLGSKVKKKKVGGVEMPEDLVKSHSSFKTGLGTDVPF